jgi:hypothetical protein
MRAQALAEFTINGCGMCAKRGNPVVLDDDFVPADPICRVIDALVENV